MKRASALLALSLLAACATAPPPPPPPPKPRPLIGPNGFDLKQLDRLNGKPCDDFYDYAVGGWRKANPLPATYARYGQFEQVGERNRDLLRAILEGATKEKDVAPGSATQKIGDFWTSCMNEEAAEQQGLAPIQAELSGINALRDAAGVAETIFSLQQKGVTPVFRFSAQNDFKNSDMIIAAVGQSGLGLPDRDYYLRDDEKFRDTRAKYLDHLRDIFVLAGETQEQAAADARRVMELETRLATASMARVDLRNPENVYHITAVSELQSYAPRFDWSRFFASVGLSDLKTLNVAQPEYLREASRMLDEVPLESWKAYLRWQVLDAAAPYLTAKFVEKDFELRGKTLSGQKEVQPRWQRCVRAADASIGQILGQEYVKRNFTPEAKQQVDELIDNLIASLRDTIPQLAWMGAETKQAAMTKLDAFKRRIGYPNKWIDTSTLEVTPRSLAENVFAARTFTFRRAVGRVGKPDDPDEWGSMTPATVNAFYSPARNDINFPAGILQPPFYDPNADAAYNYGGIGMVIGHEMTHGFDDQGAKFDAEGNLRNWWSEDDLKKFQARATCIADQYSGYEIEPGLKTQGRLVTGEAIADLGGATLAFRAYQKHLEKHGRVTLDGYTPEQRFFLGMAQVWAENMAMEEQRRRVLVDPHAQGRFRINGTVSNMKEFRDAWSCPAGSKMVRETSCDIW